MRFIAPILLLCSTLLACSVPPETSEEDAPLPIPTTTRGYLLISLDTLRADHLGLYGYPKPTSPFLDQFAARAAIFENAWAQYPSTLTSHISIFTGLYPAQHSVYPPDSVLSAEIPTLPEVFQAAGYRTGGFTEGGFMHGRFGFRRGFDAFDARDRRDADAVLGTLRRGLSFLESLEENEPYFLFLHTYSVHAPYEPPEALRKMFWEGDPPPGVFEPTGANLRRHNILDETLDPEVREYFIALYDAEIRRLDGALEEFFARIEEMGLTDDLTVIITSDHGEEFEDHGRMNHTQLYREVLRVPLIVSHPDLQGRRDTVPAQSIDLAPTLYELAQLEAPQMSGTSLATRLTTSPPPGATSPETATAFGEVGEGAYAVIGSSSGGPHQLLLHDHGPRWAARHLEIESREAVLDIELLSHEEPREIEIRLDGELIRTVEVGTSWTSVQLELGNVGPERRLRFSSSDCTLVKSDQGELRCLGFRLRGVSQRRIELFDLLKDPAQRHDLSAEQPSEVRRLLGHLEEYRALESAGAGAQELDPELRKRLEDLGYLD